MLWLLVAVMFTLWMMDEWIPLPVAMALSGGLFTWWMTQAGFRLWAARIERRTRGR